MMKARFRRAFLTSNDMEDILKQLDGRLIALREEAKKGRDPTCADETLAYILRLCRETDPQRILEIGCAEGLTTCAMLSFCTGRATAIEKDLRRASAARKNISSFGMENRIILHEGDAGEILPLIGGTFDLIFLDGPKVQYLRYLPACKRLLSDGGTLLSDDVLLFGWVRGTPPPKRRMLVEHIRAYLSALESDPELSTELIDIGEGLAVTKKIIDR